MSMQSKPCPKCGAQPQRTWDESRGRYVYSHCGLKSFSRGSTLVSEATLKAREKAWLAVHEFQRDFPRVTSLDISRRIGMGRREWQVSRASKEVCERVIESLDRIRQSQTVQ